MALSLNQRTVRERSTAIYQGSVTDAAGQPIPATALDSLTLTFYDVATGAVINGRSEQNILNANGVTVDNEGVLNWIMDPADNAILGDAAGGYEEHRALFEWTWDSVRAGNHELTLRVQALVNVP